MNEELKKALQEVRSADISGLKTILAESKKPNFRLLVLLLLPVNVEARRIIFSKLPEAENKVWEALEENGVSKLSKLNELEYSHDIINALLIRALSLEKWDIAKELLSKHTIDLSYQDMVDGNTALHALALITDFDMKKGGEILSLLDAKINSKKATFATILNSGGATALHFAAMSDNIIMIQWLIYHGIDVSRRNKEHETALDTAVYNNQFRMNVILAILKLCQKKGILIPESDEYLSEDYNLRKIASQKSTMRWAIEQGDVEIIEYLKTIGFDIKAHTYNINGERYTALQLAAMLGSVEMLEYLLKQDLNINDIPTNTRYPVLHLAVARGNAGAIQLLLASGANIHDVDKDGKTALHIAAMYGNAGAIQLLLASGAKVEDVDKDKKTALHHAARSGDLEALKLLFNNGADIKAVDRNDCMAINYAADGGKVEAIQFLLKHGGFRTTYVRAIHHAVTSGNAEAVELFLNHGVDVNARVGTCRSSNTPLDMAARYNALGIVELLLANNAEIAGATSGNPEIAALLEAAKDPNKLLITGVIEGDLTKVKIALGRGVDDIALNDMLDLALTSNHPEIAELLKHTNDCLPSIIKLFKLVSTHENLYREDAAKSFARNYLHGAPDDQSKALEESLKRDILEVVQVSEKSPRDQAELDKAIQKASVRFSSRLAINLGDNGVGLAAEVGRKVENDKPNFRGRAAAETERRDRSPTHQR
jgi:ankyrin repeat protein